MNTESNKISMLKTTPFDKLRANVINQSFLRFKIKDTSCVQLQVRFPHCEHYEPHMFA